MDIIRFLLDAEKLYSCTIYTVSKNIIRIIFSKAIPDDDLLISGFKSYNIYNENVQGDFSEYTTVYRRYDDDCIIELSNDGSVYVEPEIIPVPTPEPYDPTLLEVKTQKISELSSICRRMIENGVDVEIDGHIEHFPYSLANGDQNNIDDIAKLAGSTKLGQSYHSDDGDCKIYTVPQVINIFVAAKTNKMENMTYFNQMKQYVKSFTTDDEDTKNVIRAIAYGDPLTGKYLDTYNTNIVHSQLVVETELKNFGLNIEELSL